MTETIHFLVWLLLLFVLLIKDVEGDNLVLVQAVFRHGDRSPTHSFPNDRYAHYWPQGLGQLTKVGKQQEYRLGNFYKEKYIDTAFLGPNYNHSEIHIRSTDVDRTLMSAYCVLSGMFPPRNGSDQQWNPEINWQPIPVHTIPINEDFLLNTNAPCPTFNKFREALLKSKVIENFTLQHQDLIKTVSEIAGLPTSIKSLFTVADAVFCEYKQNLNMSEWEEVLPLNVVIQLLDNLNVFNFYTEEMARLRGGTLLGEVIKNMQSAVDSPTQPSPKMHLYSAHDTTLVSLLRVMEVYNNRTPVYSSSVLLELWKGEEKPYVKVLFKNQTDSDDLIIIHIPGCTDECALEDFIKILQKNVVKDIHTECNPEQDKPSGINMSLVVLGSMVALLTIVVVALIVVHCRNRQTSQSYRPLSTMDDEYS